LFLAIENHKASVGRVRHIKKQARIKHKVIRRKKSLAVQK